MADDTRLIDANALKIAIKAQQVIDREINPNIATISYHNLNNIIDNAPTYNQCGDLMSTAEGLCPNCSTLKCPSCPNYEYHIKKAKRPQGKCENCDFRKFSERMIDVIVDVMNKYGITSVEELERRVRGEKK